MAGHRLFYQSSQQADFIVRPLILFYSFLALARGLILFLDQTKREASLAQRHGLACSGWSQHLNQQASNVAELELKIENGTLLEFLRTTKNINLLRANSSKVNYQVSGPPPSPRTKVTFGSLCERIPDLAEEFEKWTGKRPTAAKLVSVTVGEIVILKLDKIPGNPLDAETLGMIFPNARNIDVGTATITLSKNDLPLIVGIIETAPFQIGDAVVVPRLEGDIVVSELGLMYMATFTLGMLTRYHPTHWTALQTIGPKGQFYPFCSRLLDYLSYSFPRAVSDVLTNLDRLA